MQSKIRLTILSLLTLSLAACSGKGYNNGGYNYSRDNGYTNYKPADSQYGYDEQYTDTGIRENPFIEVEDQKTNNVSLTSSTFSYPVVREAINGRRISAAKSAVRTEEMLNYFHYGYVNDTDDALAATLELERCPWNDETYLASVVVKAQAAKTDNVQNNIVILVDTSGSMSGIFDLVKKSLNTLIEKLGNEDTVSIVTYASGTSVKADGLTGKNKDRLNTIVSELKASGSTWGEGGIEKAYEIAYKHYINDGNNRVVLLTDGDFNVGKVSGEALTKLIKQKAADGVYLTCCGYRSYDNGTLYTLSENGNGNAYYIDDEFEAKKVFEEEFGKAMFTVAKDAKCQVEFSDAVASYRLLGYEQRQMSDEEFNDDKKDAGEIMSGHTTVALYELNLKSEYQSDYIFKTTLRYKDPVMQNNKEVVTMKANVSVSRMEDYSFASYVAEYCLTLTNSKYKGNSSYEHLLERINNDYINDAYRDNFVSIVRQTKDL